MRYCPTCRTQYTDDTLRFCLQDGASLIDRSESDTPTVAFPETPTVEARRETSQVTEWQNDAPHSKKKGGLAIAAVAMGLVLVVLGIAGVIGIWLFLNPRRENAAANNSSINISNTNRYSPTPAKSGTPQASPTVTLTPSPSGTPDIETPKQTVAEVVNGWKSMAEELDLDSYMSNYADRVDYYNKTGSSRDSVRKDKLRAFTMYDEIRINITNLSFDVSADGRTATTVFDKDWDFRGRKNSSGKVQTQLRLRNENGRWLISGERDLKVYFTR